MLLKINDADTVVASQTFGSYPRAAVFVGENLRRVFVSHMNHFVKIFQRDILAVKGVEIMATKSFLKDINVKSQAKAQSLINALESARNFRGKEVTMQSAVHEVSDKDIKKFVQKIKWTR